MKRLHQILIISGMVSGFNCFGQSVPDTAIDQLRVFAEKGNAEAQYNLALTYEGGGAVPQDYSQAMKWYLKAAESGLASAQNNLALLFDKGHAVDRNYEEAVKWYSKAAEQGLPAAQ